MAEPPKESIHSRIWREEPEADNPFAASACYCHGYDVFGDVLGKAGWIEYLYLLFMGERPSREHAKLLEDLAVALANPGPRDNSVQAAMNGSVGGSHNAACLMAALAVGAGQLGGAREVALAMEVWDTCGDDLNAWILRLTNPPKDERANVWPEMEHAPGFDPHGASCPTPIRQVIKHLAEQPPADSLRWIEANREALETAADCPLSITGVAAAAFHDLGLTSEQGEMLFLLLRLPGAAAHALEQKEFGFRNFPFYRHSIHLDDDPGPHNSVGAEMTLP
ncbi:MAG: citryl-CoA lyase [Gammaproteobacteria bacterium]|nr:citryl-CoA lyase [Gammaproteobacteria bacterium]